MKNIVNNRFIKSNHYNTLIEFSKNADEIIIVSPFLSNSLNFFPFNKFPKLKKISLITNFCQNFTSQCNIVNFIKELFEYGKRKGIAIEIFNDSILHGKIYIYKNKNQFEFAILSSANFTTKGLKINNEWGVIVDNKETIEKISNDLFSNIKHEQISEQKNKEFQEILNNNPKKPNSEENNISLIDKLKIKKNPLNLLPKITFWLKPFGVSGDFISWDRKFDKTKINLHFSAKYPRGIKINDILITYAVGYKNILSIYKVISEIKNSSTLNDRWPYYVIGKNLTPFYGKNWNKYNITITNQKSEVIENNLFDITPSKKNSFGSLMRGADKLKITEEFANYIINKIIIIENKIALTKIEEL